ncbi:MAG: type 4a pilus biogenesis protein PilO [Candidatus Omnitrophota bacterium]
MPNRIKSVPSKLDLKTLFAKNRFIFLLALSVLIFIISIIYICVPLLKNLNAVSKLYRREQLEFDRIQKEASLLDNVKAKNFTDSEHIPAALEELTRKANELGIKFDAVKQRGLVFLDGNYKILPLSIESTCDFQALGNFLGNLENLKESVTVVDKLEITREKEILPNLKVVLELGMYIISY